MSIKFFDIVIAKEFETKQNGQAEKRTVWNKVGCAWHSKSKDSMSFELFLVPGHRYVINMKEREESAASEQAPF